MMLKNSEKQYGSVSKALHWLVSTLFICQFVLIYWRRALEKSDALRTPLMLYHKSIGMTLLFIGISFIIWHFVNSKPKLPDNMSRLLKALAYFIHYALFLCIAAMPITGYVMSTASGKPIIWFDLFQWPMLIPKNRELAGIAHDLHHFLGEILWYLFAIHILGVIKHHFFDRDNVLLRMLPFAKLR